MEKQHFEDIVLGEAHTRPRHMEHHKEEIVVLGKQYEPQIFHVDELAAQEPRYTHE